MFEEFARPWLIDFIRLPAQEKAALRMDKLLERMFNWLHSYTEDKDHPVEWLHKPILVYVQTDASNSHEVIDEMYPVLYSGVVIT